MEGAGTINTPLEVEELRQRVAALERVLAERDRRTEQIESFLDHLPVLSYTAKLDGYFQHVNAAFERVLGYGEHECLSRPFVEFVHPIDRGAAIGQLRRLAAGEPVASFEARIICKDGSIRWISWTAIAVGAEDTVLGIGHDVTERKRAEAELNKHKALLGAIVESLPFDVFALGLDGRYVLQNAVAKAHYGDCLGKRPEEVCSNEHDLAVWLDNNRRAFAGEHVQREVEHTIGGKKRLYHSIVGPVTDCGRILGILGIIIDITDRRQAERDLRKLCDLLEGRVEERTAELAEEKEHLHGLLEMHEQERRLIGFEIHDGLAQFLSGAVMELGVFRRMADQGDANAWNSLDTATGYVVRSLQEARRLIHDLRPPELDESGLVTAIENLVAEVREQGDMEVEFVHRLNFQQLTTPFLQTIYRLVQEALANARRHSKSEKVHVTLCQEGRFLHVRVEDWGAGFDPNAVGRGHYGLEGIRERVRVFGGKVQVESALGRGTSISAVLPLPDLGRD